MESDTKDTTAAEEGPSNGDLESKIPAKYGPDESEGTEEDFPLLTPPEHFDSQQRNHDFYNHGADGDWTSSKVMPASRSSLYLFLLTICMFGLQIAWSVQLSYGSPYLLSLGIPKSLLAFVWIAGPLCGTIVQPYIGIKSDRCRSRFGKRRPFMVGGGIATVTSLLTLAWAKEIVGTVLGIFGVSSESQGLTTATIVFAVILVYLLNISVNVIQSGVRTFIVDNVPTHQQDTANAWATRISGSGNIVGYLFGYTNLPRYLQFVGDTQFKVLCVLASVTMLSTLAISCFSIKERDPQLDDQPDEASSGALGLFRYLMKSATRLPVQIRRVCQVQFFAWIGWFPFLFYVTTYIGEIYVEPFFAENPNMSQDEIEETWQRGTRIATLAMFIFAIVFFCASVLLPLIVTNSYEEVDHAPSDVEIPSIYPHYRGTSQAGDVEPRPILAAPTTKAPSARRSISPRIIRHLSALRSKSLTIRYCWLLSHILFFVLMWLTLLIRTTTGATILVSFVGISWAMTNWAPYALIAAEISKRKPNRHSGRTAAMHDTEASQEVAEQAGVMMGIHNAAIAAPQLIATLVSSVVFQALQKPRGSVGDDSVGWMLRFGGLCALVAAWLTTKVADEAVA